MQLVSTIFFLTKEFSETGDSVVQNGATSIVGQCVIQLARLRGISTINLIRDRYNIL